MGLPNNDYTPRRQLNAGRGHRGPIERGAGAAGIGCGTLILIWFLAKLIAVPVLIVNVIALIQAIQAGRVDSFDFSWLVISAIGLVLL